jgi:hypothetical protein
MLISHELRKKKNPFTKIDKGVNLTNTIKLKI